MRKMSIANQIVRITAFPGTDSPFQAEVFFPVSSGESVHYHATGVTPGRALFGLYSSVRSSADFLEKVDCFREFGESVLELRELEEALEKEYRKLRKEEVRDAL